MGAVIGPNTSQEAREAARAAGKEVEQAAGAAKRDAQQAASWMERELFSSNDRFELEGSVQNGGKDSITVNRGDDLPPAKLKVRGRTNVEPVAIQIQADSRGVLENEPRDAQRGVGRSPRAGAAQGR